MRAKVRKKVSIRSTHSMHTQRVIFQKITRNIMQTFLGGVMIRKIEIIAQAHAQLMKKHADLLAPH